MVTVMLLAFLLLPATLPFLFLLSFCCFMAVCYCLCCHLPQLRTFFAGVLLLLVSLPMLLVTFIAGLPAIAGIPYIAGVLAFCRRRPSSLEPLLLL
jgi:hypothetical protein